MIQTFPFLMGAALGPRMPRRFPQNYQGFYPQPFRPMPYNPIAFNPMMGGYPPFLPPYNPYVRN